MVLLVLIAVSLLARLCWAGLVLGGLVLNSQPLLLGLAMVAAGVYQWTPAKHACLEHCRAPLPGVLAGWRDGLSVLAEIRLVSGHWIACAGGLALLTLGARLLFP